MKEWKQDTRIDVRNESIEQKVSTHQLYSKWIHLRIDETANKSSVGGLLLREGYITRKLFDRIQDDINRQSDLYTGITLETHKELLEEIDRNYEEMMQQIEEAYEENVN